MSENEVELANAAFEPRGRRTETLLFQSRPQANPSYFRYHLTRRTPAVYVHERVLEHIQKSTLGALPNETIGMLLGRVCEDEGGVYVILVGAASAASDEYTGTPGSVRISVGGKAKLRARCANSWPGWGIVGWWHSHPHGPPRFSGEDMLEQSTQGPGHVGIVAAAEWYRDGRSADPLGVYVGAGCVQLESEPLSRPAPESKSSRHSTPGVQSEAPRRDSQLPPRNVRLLAAVGGSAVVLVLVAIVLTALWTQHALRSIRATGAIRSTATVATAQPRLTVLLARSCTPGEQLRLPLALPSGWASRAITTNDDTTAVSASLSPSGRSLLVDCLATGVATVGVSLSGVGGLASVPVTVSARMSTP